MAMSRPATAAATDSPRAFDCVKVTVLYPNSAL
ncbi:Uncharacterised protein [Bordetella pertussis]|nr:Uncharacterised protein [Bordetella pertussis]